jgi:hypothetical protein
MKAPMSNPADCEVRGVIRFLQADNVRPSGIHRRLVAVYGEHVMNAASVRKWCTMGENMFMTLRDECDPLSSQTHWSIEWETAFRRFCCWFPWFPKEHTFSFSSLLEMATSILLTHSLWMRRTGLLRLFHLAAHTTPFVRKQEAQLRHSIWTNTGIVLTLPHIFSFVELALACRLLCGRWF